jgi:release factor glutamine methyltransferase
MFSYKGLEIETHPEVYDPAEDTFLLLDAIDTIDKNYMVFEMGTGCGIIGLYCAYKGADVVASDINPYAVELTKKNHEKNNSLIKGNFEVRQGDLFSVLKSNELFDVIVFNPPYLPSKKQDLIGGSGWFDKAVNGGVDGLNIIKQFIEGLQEHLKTNGKAYFVFSSLSDRNKLEKIILKSRLDSKVLINKRLNNEILEVYGLKK